MAWLDVEIGDERRTYALAQKIEAALRLRNYPLAGTLDWPTPNVVYDRFTITGLDATTITASGVPADTWIINDAEHVDAPRWAGWLQDDNDWVPFSYDVVLNCDDPDPSKHIHVAIHDNTATTLTSVGLGETIANFVTAGWIESESWLIGKRGAIIKRGGFWWGEMRTHVPNDRQAAVGGLLPNGVSAGTPDPDNGVSLVTITGVAVNRAWIGKTLWLTAGAVTETILEATATAYVVARLASVPTGTAQIRDGATVLATGTVSGTPDDGLILPRPLPSERSRLAVGALEGKDLLVYAGTALQRITVDGNTRRVIWFARQDDAVAGAFSVMHTAGGKAWPGHWKTPAMRWFSGPAAGYYTHKPGDPIFINPALGEILSTSDLAAGNVVYQEPTGPEETCQDEDHPTRHPIDGTDVDVRSAQDNPCTPDTIFGRRMYASLRGWQNAVEQMVAQGKYVPPINHNSATAINAFSFATLLKFIDVNYVGDFSATADIDGDYTFSGLPDDGGPIVFEVQDWRGRTVTSGAATATGSLSFTDTPGKAYTLIVARGWSRPPARWARHAYWAEAWIADVDTSELEPSAIDPPTDEHPGFFHKRPPSTHAALADDYGVLTESGEAFVSGRRYRYRADNWQDASVRGAGDQPILATFPVDPQALYYAHLFEGTLRPDDQSAYRGMKRGRAVYGGTTWLRAADKNWYDSPIGNGLAKTLTFTATGGGATTLTLATPYYTPDYEDPDPPPDDEISGFFLDDWLVGGIQEIDQLVLDEDDVERTVTYRTPITAVSAGETTTTITVGAVAAYTIPAEFDDLGVQTAAAIEVPALNVAAGNGARVRVPYRPNWWRSRPATFTKPGEDPVTRLVRWSDDATLFWETALPWAADATTTFAFDELIPGADYEWDGSAWIEPTDNPGALPLKHLHEKFDVAYGRVRYGDFLDQTQFAELYKAINALWKTKHGVDWRGQHLDPEEYNRTSAGTGEALEGAFRWKDPWPYVDPPVPWETDHNSEQDSYGDSLAYANSVIVSVGQLNDNASNAQHSDSPLGGATGGAGASDIPESEGVEGEAYVYGGVGGSMQTRSAYGRASSIPTAIASSVEFFALAEIYGAPDDQEEGTELTVIDEFGTPGWTREIYQKYQFDAGGTELELRKFKKFGEADTDEAGEAWSPTPLGDIFAFVDAGPQVMADGGEPHPALPVREVVNNSSRGFRVADQIAVISWDFEYLD